MAAALTPSSYIGKALERFSLRELRELHGYWLAFERYTPETLPLKRIEAMGPTLNACVQMLVERGLDPANYDFEIYQARF